MTARGIRNRRRNFPGHRGHETRIHQSRRPRAIFITGSDTGVGKTLVTALLLRHLRSRGVHAVAIKPFCCGGAGDIELLHELQDGELTCEDISPFQFDEPVAPMVAARAHRRRISLPDAVATVRRMQLKCDCLLVEGIGGVLVPLGEDFSVLDLIAAVDGDVLVVARNSIGTINHSLLTLNALREAGVRQMKMILSAAKAADVSSRSNARVLAELASPYAVFSIPFLGPKAATALQVKRNCEKLKKTLARVLDFDTFSLPFEKSVKVSVKAVSENSR